jgi:tRNA(Ile)-lysidine synthase
MSKAISWKTLSPSLASLNDAPRWYIAFSGGVDSTALLHLVNSWRKANAAAPPLTAVHVNHNLQGQSDEWENHCAWICRFLDVPFVALQAAVEPDGSGLEAAARTARYDAFTTLLEKGEVLFLGHHQDDQVETFFLRLLRGAGIDGLGAMPRQRALGKGLLLRPLLDLSRTQLAAYVERQGLRSIEDPSNLDSNLDRNYLRHDVLPLLERRWPAYRSTVTRAIMHLSSASEALERVVELPETCFSALGDPGLPLGFLEEVDDDGAAQVIRSWLRLGAMQAPDQSALEEFLRQLRKASRSARPRLDTGAYCLQRYRDAVYLLPRPMGSAQEAASLSPGEALEIDGVGRLALQRCEPPGIWLAADEELELRWRGGGERARPAGKRRSADLKKWLQEAAVPPWWRERVPLLYLDNQLLAVGGLWPCQSSRWGEAGEEAEAPWELVWEPAVAGGFD